MKMTLGAFIAQLRKEKALTQKQLSEILGVSDKTVSHWEREESAPDISILPSLADILGVTVDELLAGERKHWLKVAIIIRKKQSTQRINILNSESRSSLYW